jgi:hypothetical protein
MKHTYNAPAQYSLPAQQLVMSSFEMSQMKKKRTKRNTTATRKMTMGTKAIRNERVLAVAKSRSPLNSSYVRVSSKLQTEQAFFP